MDIDAIISEAQSVALEFGLRLRAVDITDNIIDLRLYIDVELFIQVYANQHKDKLNLNLIFKNRRLCGHDTEGGRTHIGYVSYRTRTLLSVMNVSEMAKEVLIWKSKKAK